MKHLLISVFIVLLGCQSNTSKMDAKVLFDETEYNFDTLEYKKPAQHRFAVKNIGGSPLIINNVETSCGCTVPEWTKTNPARKGRRDKHYV